MQKQTTELKVRAANHPRHLIHEQVLALDQIDHETGQLHASHMSSTRLSSHRNRKHIYSITVSAQPPICDIDIA